MSRPLRLAFVVALAACVGLRAAAIGCVAPPNLIVVLADDLGYADIGVQGATHPTPHLDRMAAEGMRFTSFYAAASVCTPTRASILTGCYPRRVGLHEDEQGRGVLFPGSLVGLAPEEITLAELLHGRGYRTLCIGKWHLGDLPEFLPTRQGFDEFFGVPYSNDMGRATGPDRPPRKDRPPLPLLRGAETVEREPDQAALAARLTQEALDAIDRAGERPFFLYFAHFAPHAPHYPSAASAGRSGNGPYGDAVMDLDRSLGDLLAHLRRRGLDERTLVVFLSDNGGMPRHGGRNSPLAGTKGTSFEGGHRVPFVARWPGRVPAGSVSAEVAVSFDLYATFAGLAGGTVPADRIVDGRDLWPLLSGTPAATSPHEAFFYYHVRDLRAVRVGPWKLHLAGGGAPGALHHLGHDFGESHDVATQHPDVVARLLAHAGRARRDLGDGNLVGAGCRPPGRGRPAPVSTSVP